MLTTLVRKLHDAAAILSMLLKCSSYICKSIPVPLKALRQVASCIADPIQNVSCKAILDPRLRQARAHTSQAASQRGNTLQLSVPHNRALLHPFAQQGCSQVALPKAERLDMQPPALLVAEAGAKRSANLATVDKQTDSIQQDSQTVTSQIHSHTHTESAVQHASLQQHRQQHKQQQQEQQQHQQHLQHAVHTAGEVEPLHAAANEPETNAQQAHQQDSDSLSSLSPGLQLDIPGFHACLASDASSYLHLHHSQHSHSHLQGGSTPLDVAQNPQQEQQQNQNQQQVQPSPVETSQATAADFGLANADVGQTQHQPQQASSTIVTQASRDVMVEIVQDVVQDTQPANCGDEGQTAAAGPEVAVSPAELALHPSLQPLSDLPAAILPLLGAAQQLEDEQLEHQQQPQQQQQQQGYMLSDSPGSDSQEAGDPHRHYQHQQAQQKLLSMSHTLSEQHHHASVDFDSVPSAAQQAASAHSSEHPEVSTASQQQQQHSMHSRHSMHSMLSSDVSQAGTPGRQEQASGRIVQADAADQAVQQKDVQTNTADSALPQGVMPANSADSALPQGVKAANTAEVDVLHQTTHHSSDSRGQAPYGQLPRDTASQPHINVELQQPSENSAQQLHPSEPRPPSSTTSHAGSGSKPGKPAESDAQQCSGATRQQSAEPSKQEASRGHADHAEQTAAGSTEAGSQPCDSVLRREPSAVAAKKVRLNALSRE